MSDAITIYEAKTNLSKYIKLAIAGKPSYIGSYGEKQVVLMSTDALPVREHQGAKLVGYLEKCFKEGLSVTSIKDPSAWQREIRKDRKIMGRE